MVIFEESNQWQKQKDFLTITNERKQIEQMSGLTKVDFLSSYYAIQYFHSNMEFFSWYIVQCKLQPLQAWRVGIST